MAKKVNTYTSIKKSLKAKPNTVVIISIIVLVLVISLVMTLSQFDTKQVARQDTSNAATCSTNLVSITQPSGYTFTTGCLEADSQIYSDDTRFTFTNIPNYLAGAEYIKTGNVTVKDDSSLSWGIKALQPVRAYILWRRISGQSPVGFVYDSYIRQTPSYFTSLTDLSNFVVRKNTQGVMGVYDVYKYPFTLDPGNILNFGSAIDGNITGYSMYMVAFVPASAPLPATAPPRATALATPVLTPVATPARTSTPQPTRTATPTQAGSSGALQVVSTHNRQSDCWTVYDGSVYNITAFFGAHPGGDDKLLQYACGKDMTAKWNSESKHKSGTPNSTAHLILNTYKICVNAGCNPY